MSATVHEHDEAGPAPSERGAGPDLSQSLQFLWNKLWLLFAGLLIGAAAAGVYAYRAPRLYLATATVQVEAIPQRIVRIEQVMQEELRSEVSVNTMVQRLRCRPLLELVFASEGLAQDPLFASAGSDHPLDPAALMHRLEGMVSTKLRRDTRLVDISVTSPSAELSARIANAVVREFGGLDQSMQTMFTTNASSYLRQEAERLTTKVEAADRKLQQLREQAGSIGVQYSQNYYLPKLQEATVRLAQTRAQAERLRSSREQFTSLTNQPDELLKLPLVIAEPSLASARARAEQSALAFAAIQRRYKSKHPKYIQAEQQSLDARAALNAEVLKLPETYRLGYEALLASAASIETEIRQTETQALGLSAKEIEFNMLSRQTESDRALLDSVRFRLAETTATTDLNAPKIRAVQPAVPPLTPSSPKVPLIVAGGAGLGFLACLALVLGWHALDRSIQSVEQAERTLGLHVLTVAPRLRSVSRKESRLLSGVDAASPGAEAFRGLRTAIAMLPGQSERRSIIFTSAVPQEGKSFTCINYAAALAQQGLRTLIVDADLRRPAVEKYVRGQEADLPGLTDHLTGHQCMEEVTRPVESHPGLFFLTAGTPVPNPAELLARDGLRSFLEAALASFDRVVVDSPPVTAVSDTLAIAANCHATVLVVRSHRTSARLIQRTLRLLQQAQAKVCGVVLNLEPQRWATGYYQRGYAYGSRYSRRDRRRAPA